MENKPTLLPRPDLREDAFRRFEKYILRAVQEKEFVVDPQDIGLTALTFQKRCKDAILGFERYRYSSLIPPTARLRDIHISETTDGRLYFENKAWVPPADVGIITAKDKPAVQKLLEGLSDGPLRGKGPFSVRVESNEDLAWLTNEVKGFDVELFQDENDSAIWKVL